MTATNAPIIAAVDFATHAAPICTVTTDMARRMGAPIVLLHVMALPHGLRPETPLAKADTNEFETVADMLATDARAHMQAFVDQIQAAGVEVSLCLRFGDVIAEIRECVASMQPAMLAIGCDVPHGVMGRLFGHSFTEAVLRVATCPVLVVPAGGAAAAGRSEAQWQVVAEADG